MSRKSDRPRSLHKRLLGRALHAYWRFARGLTVGVRAVVLDDESRVFLVRHTYVDGWHLPGGGVEVGETALEALGRELTEEAGLALAGPPVLHGVFYNAAVSRRDHVVVYVVRSFTAIGAKRPDREIAEAGFFPLDALPEDTAAPTRRRLAEIGKGGLPPERW
ncbi:MAG TPA: NUDIX domain-containing protein [Microvirga sp.]|jgi:ADP-ribose pyrophosphatase YjhB (NUDIX family)|nr:NUDIX domain-containing protein [Microvirga sp.]